MFNLEYTSSDCKARAGTITTQHGQIKTPVFMPVGTCGSVKAVDFQHMHQLGAQIILGNTYHLYIRPGLDLIQKAGGLHKFINWEKPMLTDSGGFQVWSLQSMRKMTKEGVEFRSHVDGRKILFTPETVMDAQRILGADIIMAFDECPPYPSSKEDLIRSWDITFDWTKRAVEYLDKNPEHYGHKQNFFGIVQGGTYNELRQKSMEDLIPLDLPGYALGGLSVGEPMPIAYDIADHCSNTLPAHKPRYVMGVGTPTDLLEFVRRGIDMFDCVIPTRNARNGMVWTWEGVLHYKAARHKEQFDIPLDKNCSCYTCKNHSRAYLRHLFHAQELTVLQLASIHNLHFFCELMAVSREKILSGDFEKWSSELLQKWKQKKAVE